MLQTFDEARRQADHYAASERKHKRQAYLYFGLTLLSAGITALISPPLVLPNLVMSAAMYLGLRYRESLWTQAKHTWYKWKAARQSPSMYISMEALVPASDPQDLLNLANESVTQQLNRKADKVKFYESHAILSEDEPLPYYDAKHKRALFQYAMLCSTKEHALRGRGDFILQMGEEKMGRRSLKVEILKLFKPYLSSNRLSFSLKYNPVSNTGCCHLAGLDNEQITFINQVKELNNKARYPIITLPADPAQAKEANDSLLNTLLPWVLDMNEVIEHVTPTDTEPKIIPIGNSIYETIRTYPISVEVIDARIEKLTVDVDRVESRVFELV